jgi:hypothetical protein
MFKPGDECCAEINHHCLRDNGHLERFLVVVACSVVNKAPTSAYQGRFKRSRARIRTNPIRKTSPAEIPPTNLLTADSRVACTQVARVAAESSGTVILLNERKRPDGGWNASV